MFCEAKCCGSRNSLLQIIQKTGEEVVDQLFYLVNILTLHGGVSDM